MRAESGLISEPNPMMVSLELDMVSLVVGTSGSAAVVASGVLYYKPLKCR